MHPECSYGKHISVTYQVAVLKINNVQKYDGNKLPRANVSTSGVGAKKLPEREDKETRGGERILLTQVNNGEWADQGQMVNWRGGYLLPPPKK